MNNINSNNNKLRSHVNRLTEMCGTDCGIRTHTMAYVRTHFTVSLEKMSNKDKHFHDDLYLS